MLLPVKGEPIVDGGARGRWEYVYDTETKQHSYLHLTCDVLSDKEGFCMMCGAASPIKWTVIPEGSII